MENDQGNRLKSKTPREGDKQCDHCKKIGVMPLKMKCENGDKYFCDLWCANKRDKPRCIICNRTVSHIINDSVCQECWDDTFRPY